MDPNNETPRDDNEAPNPETDALAAMDEGIKQADADEGVEQAQEVDQPEAEEAQPDGEPEAAEIPQPEDGEQEQPDQPDPEGEAKAAAEAEADALGLKPGKSRERFHELTAQVREAAPVIEAIKAAGIEAAELPEIIQRAQAHNEWVGHVVNTGASPEQYGMTLDYLSDIGAAGRGDMAAAERAFEKVMGEAKALAEMLGKPLEGIYDPLDGHDDLKALVDELAIPREKAIEIARDRQVARTLQQGREASTEQARAQQDVDAGIDSLIQLDAHFRQNDPGYEQKRPVLNAMVANIRATLPPSQWAQATQQAYASIPAMAAPQTATTPQAPKPPVGRVPLRGAGTHGRLQQAQFDDPLAALNAGIEAAG